jgi:hypothetical protein
LFCTLLSACSFIPINFLWYSYTFSFIFNHFSGYAAEVEESILEVVKHQKDTELPFEVPEGIVLPQLDVNDRVQKHQSRFRRNNN